MVIYMSIIYSCLFFSYLGSLIKISANLNPVLVLNETNLKGKKRKHKCGKNEADKGPIQKKQNKDDTYFFCRKSGHLKDCAKYYA